MFDAPVCRFLTECVACGQGEEGWNRIREKFDRELRTPRMEAYEAMASRLENTIQVCRTALEGKPHLEFLFNNLCESAAITDVLACHPNPEFRSLLQDVCICMDTEGQQLLDLMDDDEEDVF